MEYRDSLILASRQGRLQVVSDASYAQLKNKYFSAVAYYMETTSQQHHWQGSGLIYAPNHSSYCGEIYGMYLVSHFFYYMWPITSLISVSVHV